MDYMELKKIAKTTKKKNRLEEFKEIHEQIIKTYNKKTKTNRKKREEEITGDVRILSERKKY